MAQPPDGQSCETCAYFIKATCRRIRLGAVQTGRLVLQLEGWRAAAPNSSAGVSALRD